MVPSQGGASEPSPSLHNPEHTVIFGSVDPDILSKGEKHQGNDNDPQEEKETHGTSPKVTSSTCRPVAKERPRIELLGDKIDRRIEFMKDHAIIGKIIGFWPTERALNGWIAAKWKPKGDVTLQLGPKGFFTAIFFCLEDKYRILGGGLYFFNSAGL